MSSQGYGLSGVMYGSESWTIKNAEHRRIDAFELWCWRRHLRVPWTARSNQSILKEISPDYSLEGRCWNWSSFWPLDAKNWLIWKEPDAGKDWRQEEKGMTEDEMVGWHHWLNGQEFEQAPGINDGQESLVCCSPWGHKELDMTKHWTDWRWTFVSKMMSLLFNTQSMFAMPHVVPSRIAVASIPVPRPLLTYASARDIETLKGVSGSGEFWQSTVHWRREW